MLNSNNKDIRPLLHPEVIAVFGVSHDRPEGAGMAIYERLKRGGHKVHPVNPEDRRCHPSLDDIPSQVDLAILAISSDHLKAAVNECVSHEVGAVIVYSKDPEDVLEGFKDKIRILGPNTLGHFRPDTTLDTLLVDEDVLVRPDHGKVAFISQSGFLALPFFEALEARSLGLSIFADVGEKRDISEIDLLEYISRDDGSEVIALYLEDLSSGRKLFEIAKELNGRKNIVLLKGGTTKGSKDALKSHTGAISSTSRSVLYGVAEQCGIIIAEDETELVDFTTILAMDKKMGGDKVAVLGTTGSMGIIAADKISSSPVLDLSKLSERTKEELEAAVPHIEFSGNPVDLSPLVNTFEFTESVRISLRADEISAVLIFLSVSPNVSQSIVDELIHIFEETDKPLVIVLQGETSSVSWAGRLKLAGIPVYPSSSRAVRVLEALYRSGRHVF